MSTTTGPGRPLRAMSNAVRIVISTLASSVTRKTFFAQAAMMLKTGASWKASVPEDGGHAFVGEHRHDHVRAVHGGTRQGVLLGGGIGEAQLRGRHRLSFR